MYMYFLSVLHVIFAPWKLPPEHYAFEDAWGAGQSMLLKENWVSRPAPRSHRVCLWFINHSKCFSTSFKSIAYFIILLWYGMIKDVQHISTLPAVPAQGGGARFKNRKPIREGCCESRLAELIQWWTDRWLELFPTLTCGFLFLVLYPLRHIHHTHTLTHTYITHTYITHIHSLTHTTHIHHIHTLTHTYITHTQSITHTHISHIAWQAHTHHLTLHSHTHHRLTWSVLLIFLSSTCLCNHAKSQPPNATKRCELMFAPQQSVGDWSWSVLPIFLAPRAVGNEA